MSVQHSKPTVLLHCLAASAVPAVIVIARYRPTRWTCILKWDIRKATLTVGSWTRMRIKIAACRVSRDAEWWEYSAEGRLNSPFDPRHGGGSAIARTPWLAALTDIKDGRGAQSLSKDALRPDEQQALRALIDESQPLIHRSPWQIADSKLYSPARIPWSSRNRRIRVVAVAPIPSSTLQFVSVSDRFRRTDGHREHRRLFIESSPHGPSIRELPNFTWVLPLRNETFAASTTGGTLQCLRLTQPNSTETRFREEQSHDLTSLKPNPQKAPAHARASLHKR